MTRQRLTDEERAQRRREYMRKYRARNKEAIRARRNEQRRESRAANPDLAREQDRKNYQRIKEQRREYMREYYQRNKARRNESRRQWTERNREHYNAYQREYRRQHRANQHLAADAPLASYEREVDPEGTLDPKERTKRALRLREAHILRTKLEATQ